MENLKKCICSKCPSYTLGCKIKEMPKNLLEIAMHHSDLSKVEHLEGMFCAFGKSKCLAEEKGCNCTKCEVYKEYNLSKIYFCIRDI
ncbi:DUF2769 domain-containing protein [Cetobacterium sp. 2A]|nr:DUF2769 domain-containing protein [Cetobacterium sp. 2A]